MTLKLMVSHGCSYIIDGGKIDCLIIDFFSASPSPSPTPMPSVPTDAPTAMPSLSPTSPMGDVVLTLKISPTLLFVILLLVASLIAGVGLGYWYFYPVRHEYQRLVDEINRLKTLQLQPNIQPQRQPQPQPEIEMAQPLYQAADEINNRDLNDVNIDM